MIGYLPKEAEDSLLNKTVLRAVWTNKVVVNAIGVNNENEAREWFRLHPHVHQEFVMMEQELHLKITELQQRAYNGLRSIVVKERGEITGFDYNSNINYPVKNE
jgi:hypothetical protein